ncbi:MAG: type II toxin-antitoxin system VapC family toxin [Planctomycetota bacterium]
MNYFDTSVITACYCPESRSDRAQRLLSRSKQPTISPLVELELYCVVSRKVRARELDDSSARLIFAEFQRHLTEPRFHIVPVQTGEYALARQWLETLSSALRSVDALHLAAAFNNDLVLLTADRGLAQAAKAFGVKHKLIS